MSFTSNKGSSGSSESTCLFLLLLLFLGFSWKAVGLSADGAVLQELRLAFPDPKSAVFSNWEEGDPDPCRWSGVQCAAEVQPRRVISVTITGPSLSLSVPTSMLTCVRVGADISTLSCPNQSSSRGNSGIPESIGNLTLLRSLSLPFNGLGGRLPSRITELRLLEILDLRGNAFSGIIPPELARLGHLRVLNLAHNSFSGSLPLSLFRNLSSLELFSVAYNQLVGAIPSDLSKGCRSLQHLNLAGNFLTGPIPDSLANCSNLQYITLSSNFLMGRLPVPRFPDLRSLDVSRNCLDGEIPLELANSTSLSFLILTNPYELEPCINKSAIDPVEGYQSDDKGEFNYFSGGIPLAISELPQLRVIWAPSAGLSGLLPASWGKSLEFLNLAANSFVAGIPAKLAECGRLTFLDLSANQLTGNVPPDLAVNCMAVFNVSGNALSGELVLNLQHRNCLLPNQSAISSYTSSLYCAALDNSLPEWFRFPNVSSVVHDFSQNNLTGPLPIPPLLTSLQSLFGVGSPPLAYRLLLSGNRFTGIIPNVMFESCLGLHAFSVDLSRNNLFGGVPWMSIAKCGALVHLEAESSGLQGQISAKVAELQQLVYLDLAGNRIYGGIPLQLGELHNVKYISLANNSLNGTIPGELGGLSALLTLDLSGNELEGEIPEELSKLSQLKELMLNNNSLSGVVPASFARLASLTLLNLAFNNLTGALPRVRNMKAICTGSHTVGNHFSDSCTSAGVAAPNPTPAPPAALPHANIVPDSFGAESHHHVPHHELDSVRIAAVAAGCTIFIVLVVILCLIRRSRLHLPATAITETRKEVVTFGKCNFNLTYESVVRATGGFSVDNLIGNGGFGATYKAELTPGFLVAVKRLSLGRFHGVKQFHTEIRTLGRIRHPNLVTLIGYHASESEMFLIYNYLPGGNLESLIHEGSRGGGGEEGFISWRIRYKIALDIAQALAYLHDECTPRVLHRDIKPSNILLDNSKRAYLSDFGLARLLGVSETHATTDVAGTFGYVAPEYAMTCRVSDKADVYSYGVVLLELLSGKRALDPSFSQYGNGFNIVAWACQQLERGRPREVFAAGLWEQQGLQSELIEVLKLAASCTVDSLPRRPTMRQVVACLKRSRLLSSSSSF